MCAVTFMHCPNCGKEMEHGFVRAESFIGGVKWMTEVSSKSLGLETISKPNGQGFCFLEGDRCKECRKIVIQC